MDPFSSSGVVFVRRFFLSTMANTLWLSPGEVAISPCLLGRYLCASLITRAASLPSAVKATVPSRVLRDAVDSATVFHECSLEPDAYAGCSLRRLSRLGRVEGGEPPAHPASGTTAYPVAKLTYVPGT